MREIVIKPGEAVPLGFRGENDATQILFDVTGWAEEFGEGVFQLLARLPGDEDAYTVPITTSGGYVRWIVTSGDTAIAGSGAAQLEYYVSTALAKSCSYLTVVAESLGPSSGIISDAEAWAIGERDGEPVQETDETYHNNAKYYAGEAEASAEQAATSADSALETVRAAGTEQVQRVQAAGETQIQAVAQEGAARQAAVVDEGSTQVQRVQTAGDQAATGVEASIETQGNAQIQRVQDAAGEQIAEITQEGSDQRGAVADAGTAEIQRIQTVGAQTSDAIGDIVEIAEAAQAAATQSASDAEGSATAAAASATRAAGSATAAAASAAEAQTAAERDVPAAAAAWLSEHVDPSTGYVLDDSLTIQGAAADAKAAGTAINDVKSAINVSNTINPSIEQGGIAYATGANATNAKRCRTNGYLQVGGISSVLYAPTGLEYYIYLYNDQSIAGYVGPITNDWITGEYTITAANKYIRVVFKNSANTNIVPADVVGVTLTNIGNTDKTLTIPNKPADALTTGELLATKIGTVTLLTSEDDLNDMQQGTYRWISDNAPINSPTKAGGVMFAFGGSRSSALAQLIINYGSFVYYRIAAGQSFNEWRQLPTKFDAFGSSSWGISNSKANIQQMLDIKWTPKGNIPSVLAASANVDPITYFTQEEQTGLPYSSARDQDKNIGFDISIHTFMTAVNDPNSVLYRRRSTCRNSSTYYGAVCSDLVSYAVSLAAKLPSRSLLTTDLFETIPMQSITDGDIIAVDGHVAIIESVARDAYGRIAGVTVAEEWRPLPRRRKYGSWNAFINDRSGYIARRYKHIDSVSYQAIPYVQCFDEIESEIVYPDIQPEYGDQCVYKVGETANIHVIDTKNYTQIVVKRGDTTVQTITNIADFSISNLSAGLYTITATGSGTQSVSTFFVADITATFDSSTGDVTFSSTNATPVLVTVYNLPSDRIVGLRPTILTDENRTRGSINVSSLMDGSYKNCKVSFMTPYGTAVWYSETHEKWIPIT